MFWHKDKFETVMSSISCMLKNNLPKQHENKESCVRTEDDKSMEKMAEHEIFWNLKWNLCLSDVLLYISIPLGHFVILSSLFDKGNYFTLFFYQEICILQQGMWYLKLLMYSFVKV